MYCGKCGSKIPEGSAFCESCGSQAPSVEVNLPLAQQNNVENIVENKLLNKRKYLLSLIGVFLLIIACVVCISLSANNSVDGRYFQLCEGNGYIDFSDGKYKYYSTFDSETAWHGTYEVKDGKLITIDSLTGEESIYDIYKNYLVPTDYLYQGIIPNEKRFQAICRYKDSSYEFRESGKLIYTDKNGKEMGTYYRSDEIINCSLEARSYNLLVYKNQINDSAFKKAQ